jgi:hypothetical protein
VNSIKELLTDVAGEAPGYDVTDRAVSIVRRRRRIAVAAPLAVAALVVFGLVAAVPLRPANDTDPAAPSPVESWLPARLRPAPSPPPLPAALPVPAALTFTLATKATILVTEDGRQYRSPGRVDGISPDGRWLTIVDGGRLTLRRPDGTSRDLGDEYLTETAAWSPGSRWLALRMISADAEVRNTTVLDLSNDRVVTVSDGPYRDTEICGVLDSGDVLLCTSDTTSIQFDVRWIDLATGQQKRHTAVDTTAALTPNERQADSNISYGFNGSRILLLDGRTLLVRTTEYLADRGVYLPGDLLAVDLDNPEAMPRRYDLPPSRLGTEHRHPGGDSSYDPGDTRTGLAVVPAGLLVMHTVPGGSVAAVELVDMRTGELIIVTSVRGGIRDIMVRG